MLLSIFNLAIKIEPSSNFVIEHVLLNFF